jgi:tight adherence protein B
MELILAYGFTFGSIATAVAIAYPEVTQRFIEYVDRQSALAAAELSDVFLHPSQRTMWALYAAAPLIIGVMAVLITGRLIFGVIGLTLGVLVPSFLVRQARARHRKKFHDQLVDGLLLLSSSLKAGLSMTQAFTVIAEEMPAPISQEFGLILKEARMGVNLDEALLHMKQRVPGDDVSLFITAVLVARETGGDITHVFGRLVETLRDRKKLKERIATLTFMARLQGFVMAMLPFAFGVLVYQMNKDYFRFFLFEPLGRMMLVAIVLLQTVGTLLYLRFSRSPL